MPTSIDFSGRFGGTPTGYELVGNWPAGLSINSSGVVSGSATVAGYYPGLRVKATNDSIISAQTNTFAMTVSKFAALAAAFDGEMKGVEVGTGGLTATHTADLYAPDAEGIYRAFAANEPVWAGGRVVVNRILQSQQFDTTWTLFNASLNQGVTDPDGGLTAATLTATGATGRLRQSRFTQPIGVSVWSIWIRRRTGTGTVRIAANIPVDITSEVTTDWKRFAISQDPSVENVNIDVFADVSGDEIDVAFAQYEVFDAGTVDPAPSEYVPTTTAPVTKAFANANGNTVASNVVTEAVGAPLAEVPYLQYYPAAQNDCEYSNDLTQGWTGTFTATLDEVGLTGEPNTASTLTSTAPNHAREGKTSPTGQSNVGVLYVKQGGGDSVSAALYIGIGGAETSIVSFNPQTGGYISNSGTALVAYEIISLDNDWFKVLIETNAATGTVYNFEIQASTTAAPATIIVGNAEIHFNKTLAEVRGLGPIFTEASAVATDVVEYSFDIANATADQHVWYMEENPSFNTGETNATNTGLFHYFSTGTRPLYYTNSFAIILRLTGVTNGPATVANTPRNIAWYYQSPENEQDMNVDGAYQSAAGYTLTTLGTEITVSNSGNKTAAADKFRNIQRYDAATIAESKTLIDSLMA
jgi:hypothetical protein